MYAATGGGTSSLQGPPLKIRSRTIRPEYASFSSRGSSTTRIPFSRKSRTTSGEFVYTRTNLGRREPTWPTHTEWTCVSGIGTMWYAWISSASSVRRIISYRSPAVNGFSRVWEYCADPMPITISPCAARIRRPLPKRPRGTGWPRPTNRGRSPGTRAHLLRDRPSDRPIEQAGLRHDRRELHQEALLLRPDEGVLQDLLERLDRADLDPPDVAVLEEDVLHVRLRDDDLADPHLRGGLDLGGDAAHGEHLPADAERAGHRDADRRGVPLRALSGTDELDVDVMVRDVFARVSLDQRGHVLHRLLRELPEAPRRDDLAALLRLRGRDLRRDREDEAGELREAVVCREDRESIDDADDRALRDERAILLPPLDESVRDLLLEGPRRALRVHDVLREDQRRAHFHGDVPGDADEASELAQPQGELPPPSRAPLRLSQDLADREAVEMGDLLVLGDLLRDESHELHPVRVRVPHRALHVDLVPVAADPRAERGMHAGDRVQVSGGDEQEVARDRLRLDHRPARALALPHDAEPPLLHRGQEGRLAFDPKDVDLVDEQDALVGLVDRARPPPPARGRFGPAAPAGGGVPIPN